MESVKPKPIELANDNSLLLANGWLPFERTMKLKQKGRYFELPIVGQTIKKIIFDGLLTLVFDDQEESHLKLHSTFKVTQYNQTVEINPGDKDALTVFYDNYGQSIKDAKADGEGNLWLTFDNGTEITLEDGPYENWHYTKRNLINPMDSLNVHGGVGRTVH
ncbi:MAG: hypothetical protein GC178_11100 [Flavobacteriales bacterium]|nr:hypothetical protein [Flavobacteriales bacterium]